MSSPENLVPFGVPAIEPRWTSGAKEGMGTEYYMTCRVWFTLAHGINQAFYPHAPQRNTRGSLGAGFNRAPRRTGAGKTRRAKARKAILTATLTDEFA